MTDEIESAMLCPERSFASLDGVEQWFECALTAGHTRDEEFVMEYELDPATNQPVPKRTEIVAIPSNHEWVAVKVLEYHDVDSETNVALPKVTEREEQKS